MKYQKIKTEKSKTKLILALLALVLIGSGLLFYRLKIYKPSSSQKQEEVSQTSTTDSNTNTDQAEDQNPTKFENQDANNQDAAKQQEQASQPANSNPTAIVISKLEQSSGKVNLLASLSGASTTSCQIKFVADDGSVVNQTAKVESGSCSLSLSELEFSYLGNWSVTVSSGSASANSKVVIQ